MGGFFLLDVCMNKAAFCIAVSYYFALITYIILLSWLTFCHRCSCCRSRRVLFSCYVMSMQWMKDACRGPSLIKLCYRELTFKKGDAVNIIRQIDNNWYEGEHRGRVGIFPIAYVEVSRLLISGLNMAWLYLNMHLLQHDTHTGLHHFSHIYRRCRLQRSSSQSVLLLQHMSERLERQWPATTLTLILTWSCHWERYFNLKQVYNVFVIDLNTWSAGFCSYI